jgi:D-sedoheptulose 7-phosphate isomerase
MSGRAAVTSGPWGAEKPGRPAAILSVLIERHPGLAPARASIGAAFDLLSAVLRAGRGVLVCGNGGSAADSEHITGELAKPCALPRPLPPEQAAALRAAGDDGYLAGALRGGLPVLSLVSQAALVSAIANDQAADVVFAQQVLAYGRPGDLLWALTTSGGSVNVLHALRTARALGLRTLAMTGPSGTRLAELCDVLIVAPGADTQQVQESHLPIYHALCLAIEAERYG